MKENNKISVKDIAKLSNVSIGTVDRVIHNRKGVSETTRKLVQDIIDQTGYKKNIIASRLASKKTIRIITLLPAGTNEFDYWHLHQQGLDQAYSKLLDLGLELQHFHFEILKSATFKKQWDVIKSLPFDGIITVPVFENLMEGVVHYCNIHSRPIVFVDAMSEKFPDIAFIGQNAFKAGRVCARLMVNITDAKSKYLLVNISTGNTIHINNLQRDHGFRSFFKDNGLNNQIYTISNQLEDRLEFIKELKTLIKRQGNFEGILVTNSRSSFVVDALDDLGMKDMKVIGFDLNEKNINHLKEERIHFLIDQKPQLQSKRAVDAAFNAVAYRNESIYDQSMPVEIFVKENLG